MKKVTVLTSLVIASIFVVSSCSGSSSDNDKSTVTTVRQKNAALSTATLPLPSSPPTTKVYNVPGMSATTTVPCLPPKKMVGPFCK